MKENTIYHNNDYSGTFVVTALSIVGSVYNENKKQLVTMQNKNWYALDNDSILVEMPIGMLDIGDECEVTISRISKMK